MARIKVENLSFSYPSSHDPIFENVSFEIDTDWKLGFVGRNGRGKTTFLQLLLGRYAHGGRIISPVGFTYFPYPVSGGERPAWEVLREVCPGAQDWALTRELRALGMDVQALERPFCSLSGGEQAKALLAALFLQEGNFLLIDEPTNHLDAQARASVAAYLQSKKGFILVSHDRRVLDSCVDHILAINRANIEVQSGNFSSWMANFERQQASELARKEQLRREIDGMRRSARQAAAWSDRAEAVKRGNGPVDRGYIGHKAAKMMKRAKAIEARREKAIEEKAGLLRNFEEAEAIKLVPLLYRAKTLVSLREVAPAYGGRPVCAPVTFAVERGERIALRGRNGSGKSSLLRLMAGEDIAYSGTLRVGSGLMISCVPQDTSSLRGTLTDYARARGLPESLFKAMLRKLDFERVQFEKRMETFSGGQKKKVLIAASLCERAHLYLWDEPLNFIDVYSRMQIEQLILTYAPTMVFVEHDAAFCEAVATKTISL